MTIALALSGSMPQIRIHHLLLSFGLALVIASALPAQTHEIGAQFSGMHLHKIDEAPLSIGVRFHYNLSPKLAADTELNHAPQNPAGNFGETSAMFGIRVGKRFERFGLFVKARTGLIHFGGEYFQQRLDQKTNFMADYGGILEYYPRPHLFVRIDAADAVIYYGSARLFNRPNPDALGTVHNFQPGFGLGIRF